MSEGQSTPMYQGLSVESAVERRAEQLGQEAEAVLAPLPDQALEASI